MAAAYAAVVPILEVPSGILADRWSRRGVLMAASAALALSALIGGLSHNVGHLHPQRAGPGRVLRVGVRDDRLHRL